MRIVVTGGSGFIGSHVAEALVQRGHAVTVLDSRGPVPEVSSLPGCRFVRADLLDPASIVAGLEGADAVCHLAGVSDVYVAAQEPHVAALLNVVGTAHVADAARKCNTRKLVYASTWEVYGTPVYQPLDEAHPCNPDHPYSVTKYAGERLVLSYDVLKDLPAVALRLGTAYGLRMRPTSVFSQFIGRARRGEPIVVHGTGEQSRQFTHVTDIARAFVLAVESNLRGVHINCVSERSVSIRELAELVRSRLPTRIERASARDGEVAPSMVSSVRARQLLGWSATADFESALEEMLDASDRASFSPEHSDVSDQPVRVFDHVAGDGVGAVATRGQARAPVSPPSWCWPA